MWVGEWRALNIRAKSAACRRGKYPIMRCSGRARALLTTGVMHDNRLYLTLLSGLNSGRHCEQYFRLWLRLAQSLMLR
jgi:hypothetical protein